MSHLKKYTLRQNLIHKTVKLFLLLLFKINFQRINNFCLNKTENIKNKLLSFYSAHQIISQKRFFTLNFIQIEIFFNNLNYIINA